MKGLEDELRGIPGGRGGGEGTRRLTKWTTWRKRKRRRD
jgi:hypothetical protein